MNLVSLTLRLSLTVLLCCTWVWAVQFCRSRTNHECDHRRVLVVVGAAAVADATSISPVAIHDRRLQPDTYDGRSAPSIDQSDYILLGLFRSVDVVGIYWFGFSVSIQMLQLLSLN